MNKPQQLADFKKGKAWGAIDHLCDTLNWVVQFINNLKGEDGITIEDADTDRPIIRLDDDYIDGAGSSGCFSYSKGKIVNCHFKLGRNGEVVTLPDKVAGNGTWYLTIIHSNPSSSTISTNSSATTSQQTCIPLMTIENGKVTQDYRGMPIIPMWDEIEQ